jgi:hypothetical protein
LSRVWDQAEVASMKLDGLEVCTLDARRWLKQIEHHLHLSGASSRPRAKQGVPPSINAAR